MEVGVHMGAGEEPWVAEWLEAEREPVFFSEEAREWRVLQAMWEGEGLRFRYFGGSTPGEERVVGPRRVFRVRGYRGLYFSGWCAARGGERTFRVERAAIV